MPLPNDQYNGNMMSHRFFYAVIALMYAVSGVHASPATVERDPSREWLDVPWKIRYVILIDSVEGMKAEIKSAIKYNLSDGKNGKNWIYLDAIALFASTASSRASKTGSISTLSISFDEHGRVLNTNSFLSQFNAKRSIIESLVLIRTNDPTSKPYAFADWNQGIPGDVSFSPAVCTIVDSHRYDTGWRSSDPRGHVGCREWTAQLYDPGPPYIDVTTYSKRGNFIGELVGWSRFEDPPKPVIGMQGKQWLCLHECPSGERPGVIADLRAWTRKHGYPMPERPPFQPLYPDSEYQDDLNEFWNY